MRTTNNTEEDTNHTEESSEEDSESGTSLGLRLESIDGVDLGGLNESEDLLADEGNRVFLQGNSGLRILLIDLVGSLVGGLLEGVLDKVGLLGELIGILDGVTDVDVVKEDVLSHGPEFNTNTALRTKDSEAVSGD